MPLKFVPKGPVDSKSALVQVMAFDSKQALVQVMVWYLIGTKPLSDSMLTQIYDTLWRRQGITSQNHSACDESY